MRISCNGCRVLRKGCSDDCTLRPCLDWIKSCESQANATLFLAKFYGRAGLLNLINAGPQHLRPAIFRSLLYEACGRIVNPVYGSVGLMWSKDWNRCQAAVDAVLIGSPIMQFSPDGAASAMHSIMPLNGCDIRHLAKDPLPVQNHSRFKLCTGRDRGKTQLDSVAEFGIEATRFLISGWGGNHPEELNRNPSHDSSMLSVETVEASLANQDETNRVKTFGTHDEESEVGLDLSLGYNPVQRAHMPMVGKREVIEISDGDAY